MASPPPSPPASPPRASSAGRRRAARAVARACDRAASAVLIAGVVVYKCTLSPLLGRQCRFHPTCSAYFREAVEKYGAVRGALRGLARIGRCHPWHPGGYDPP